MKTIHKHSAGGVVYDDGRVLTINWQTKTSIEFPKGGIEPGESPEHAALREVAEETGYRVQSIAPLGSEVFEYDTEKQHYRKMVDYFLMELPKSEALAPEPQREPGENFENLWLSVRQANRRLTFDDGREVLQRAVDIINLLGTDDQRTTKYVSKIVRRMSDRPNFVPVVIGCMTNKHRGLAMRAADSLEKFSRLHTETLQPLTSELIRVLKAQLQKEVRWHLAQILPRLKLTDNQLKTALKIWVDDFYNSTSNIVQTMSLQAVHDIAEIYDPARKKLDRMLDDAIEKGAPAVKARAHHLR